MKTSLFLIIFLVFFLLILPQEAKTPLILEPKEIFISRHLNDKKEKNDVQSDCKKLMKVLITGISGMIGSHVAHLLVKNPCFKVFGLIRPRSNLDTLRGVVGKINFLVGDLGDSHRMIDIIANVIPDFVYHFGAQAINGISYANADTTLDINVRGTLNLLEGIRRAGLGGFGHPCPTRVMLAGSSTEYGRTVDLVDGPLSEDLPLRPVTPYGVSKVAMELLGNQYNTSYGIPVITARFFIQLGVGGTDNLAIHQFCKQIAMAEAGLAPAVIKHGNIDTSRDMTDVRDSAIAIVKLAEEGVFGEAYNIGTGFTTSIKELLILAMSHAKIPMSLESDSDRLRLYDEKILRANISKL